MKKNVFWDVTPRGFCKSRRFRGIYRLNHQGDKNRRARNKADQQPKQAAKKYCVLGRFLQKPHGLTFQKTGLFLLD
jgi:hypothetical protein